MKINLFILLLLSALQCIASTEKKAEKAALKSINKTLAIAEKDADYIIHYAFEIQKLTLEGNYKIMSEEAIKIDSIFRKCEIYRNNHLNIDLLKSWMLTSYNIENKKNDTSSVFFKLTNHLVNLSNNPSTFTQVSPSIQILALKSIVSSEISENKLIQVISAILIQGIYMEFKNLYVKNETEKNIEQATNKGDENQSIQDLEIMVMEDDEAPRPLNSSDSTCLLVEWADVDPEFPGGESALGKYLVVNNSATKGTVYVQVKIDCKGLVSDAKVIKSLSPETDKIAIDLVSAMPKWIPAKFANKDVAVRFNCPVKFL